MPFEVMTREYKSSETTNRLVDVIPWMEENISPCKFRKELHYRDDCTQREQWDFVNLMRDTGKFVGVEVHDGTDTIIKANGSNWVVFICIRPTGWAQDLYDWVRVYAVVFDDVLAVQCKLALFVD